MHLATPLRPLPGAPQRRTPPGAPAPPGIDISAAASRVVASVATSRDADPTGATVSISSRSVASTVTDVPKSLDTGEGSCAARRTHPPSSTRAFGVGKSSLPPLRKNIREVSSHAPPGACTSSSNVARSSSPTLS